MNIAKQSIFSIISAGPPSPKKAKRKNVSYGVATDGRTFFGIKCTSEKANQILAACLNLRIENYRFEGTMMCIDDRTNV